MAKYPIHIHVIPNLKLMPTSKEKDKIMWLCDNDDDNGVVDDDNDNDNENDDDDADADEMNDDENDGNDDEVDNDVIIWWW